VAPGAIGGASDAPGPTDTRARSHHRKADLSANSLNTLPQVSFTAGGCSGGELIPTPSIPDRCPIACCDGGDTSCFGGEGIPGGAASIDDGVIAVVDAVAQLVAAQKCPDILDRVQLGRVGRQAKQADVVWNAELFAGRVPSCAIEGENGVCARRHHAADFGQVFVHRVSVGGGQDQASADVARGAYGTEQIGPGIAPIARRGWTRAARGPDAGQRALLADTGFVLPPELDRLATGGFGDRGGDQSGEVFLCAAWA